MSTLALDSDAPTTAPAPIGPRRYGLATLIAAVIASLLAGFAIATVALRPAPAPAEGSPEVGFARDMIIHHSQAVDMGMIAWQRAATSSVRQLGYDIATLQQGQIGTMHQWLHDWGVPATYADLNEAMAWMPPRMGDMAGYPMPGMASQEQMDQLRAAEGLEVDRLFLELMIIHHLGGIHMVDGVLELSDHADVIWLAEIMKDGQQREMIIMRDLEEMVEEQLP